MITCHTASTLLAQLRDLGTPDRNIAFETSLGVESEMFVYDEAGNPVDLTHYIELLQGIPDVWACGTDLGKNMLEIAFNPYRTIEAYVSSWIKVLSFFEGHNVSKNWHFLFSGDAQGTCGWVCKPRYAAAIDALIAESPNGFKVVDCMTSHAAWQVNVGVGQYGGVFSHEAKKLLYAFNNWGPAVCLLFERIANDLSCTRIAHGYDYAPEYRGPHYMPWEACDNLEGEILNIPQLIVCKHGDVWEPCGQKPLEINPVHTGTIYWFARAQGIYDKEAARIEIRSPNSIAPILSIKALLIIDQLIRFVLERDVKDIPVLDKNTWTAIKEKERVRTSLQLALGFLKKLPIE